MDSPFLSHHHDKCGGFKTLGKGNVIFTILIPTPHAMSRFKYQGPMPRFKNNQLNIIKSSE